MGTGSRDEDGQKGFEDVSEEPLGLAATAFGNSPRSRSRTPVPPEHQQAVELSSDARQLLRQGQTEAARNLFVQVAELELQVLKSSVAQPERALIAEFGARAALQAGRFKPARDLLRKGQGSRAPEPLQWDLLRVSIQVDLLELVQAEFEGNWQVPWESTEDEDETRILVVGGNGRRLVFEVDPDADSVSRTQAGSSQLEFVIPALRLDMDARRELEELMSPWLRPAPRTEPVVEKRGVVERYVLDHSFA